jgi:hypothetical protein
MIVSTTMFLSNVVLASARRRFPKGHQQSLPQESSGREAGQGHHLTFVHEEDGAGTGRSRPPHANRLTRQASLTKEVARPSIATTATFPVFESTESFTLTGSLSTRQLRLRHRSSRASDNRVGRCQAKRPAFPKRACAAQGKGVQSGFTLS